VSASNLISSFSLSPKGERALFAARGDIFTAPIEKGAPRNLTNSSGAHDKWPRWSPDGSRIAFISDRTGEEEVWDVAQDGSKPAEQLTSGGRAMRYAPEWSPDGKYIAFGDKDGKVWALTVADKKLAEVAESKYGQVQDYTWSPKGNYLAFTMQDDMSSSSVYVWSSKDGQLRRVTTATFNEFDPAWDPQGNYLFYLSAREFAPLISNVEFNYAANKNTGVFAIALRKDVKHPFPAESDEVTITKEGAKEGEQKKPEEAKPSANMADMTIDFDGIESRASRAPIEPNNYAGSSAKGGYLF
jgi:tricorn protease